MHVAHAGVRTPARKHAEELARRALGEVGGRGPEATGFIRAGGEHPRAIRGPRARVDGAGVPRSLPERSGWYVGECRARLAVIDLADAVRADAGESGAVRGVADAVDEVGVLVRGGDELERGARVEADGEILGPGDDAVRTAGLEVDGVDALGRAGYVADGVAGVPHERLGEDAAAPVAARDDALAVVAPRDVVHRAAQGLVLRLEGHVLVQTPHANVAGDIAARHPLAVGTQARHGGRILVPVVHAHVRGVGERTDHDRLAVGVRHDVAAGVDAEEHAATADGRGRASVRREKGRRRGSHVAWRARF